MGNRPSICGLWGANSKNKPEEEIDLDMKVISKTDKIPRLKGNAASTINRNNQDLSIHNNKAYQINSPSVGCFWIDLYRQMSQT